MSHLIKRPKEPNVVYVTDFAKIGAADATAGVVAAFQAVKSGQILDLCGVEWPIFKGLAGTAAGDAVPLAGVPRLAGKVNVLVRNGGLYAADPSASGAKLRFPSTLAIDGCLGIRLKNVRMVAKGENWGDADASQPLTYEQRRPFLAQNGGHACVVIRSKGVTFDSCRFEKAGSCGAMYMSSSDDVTLNSCYASAESLGYAAYAADAWCGHVADAGWVRFSFYLNNCRSDNNGAAYGSKGCVVTEDSDVWGYVQGGVYKDAYPNGGAPDLGVAFSANTCHLYVDGAMVENCSAVGMSTNSAGSDTILEVKGVRARGIRTTMHVNGMTSFGVHRVKYQECDVEIVGSQLWPAVPELSRSTVIANRKITTVAEVDVVNTVTTGAHTFAINSRASYGGVRVIGGRHRVSDRIFDSVGWGGAGAGTERGFEVLGGAVFKVNLADTANPSQALSQATTAINAIRNQDAQNVYTYQYVHFDESVRIEANLWRDFMNMATLGANLQERVLLLQAMGNCYQAQAPGAPRVGAVKVVSLDGVAGALYKVTFTYVDGKGGTGLTLADDTFAVRRSQGNYAGPNVVGAEVRWGVYLNGGAPNLTVGTVYPATFTG